MRNIYRRLITVLVNAWAWMLDYFYVARWQIRSLFPHSNNRWEKNISGGGDKIPVVIIPGVYENWYFMKPVVDMLHRHGHPIHVLPELKYNIGTVEEMAAVAEAYIVSMSLRSCIVVAHSKGGLVGKMLLIHHSTSDLVKGVVAINTPFSGSRYAYFLPLRNLRIFTPTSPTLSLLGKEREANKKIVSIYGLFDPHIPSGSSLEGAHNRQLHTRGHFRPLNDHQVHEAIVESITYLLHYS